MEKRFTYLLGLSKHTENILMYNELKELKKEVLKFPMLRLEAMERRIKELEQENSRLQDRELELTTYIFELLDKDCPEDYKRVVKSEVFNN